MFQITISRQHLNKNKVADQCRGELYLPGSTGRQFLGGSATARGKANEARAGRASPGRRAGRLAKFRQNVARFRLYRLRFLQQNMRFAAFFKIYQILKLKFLKFDKILQILQHLQIFV